MHMRILILVLFFALSGCATTQYGNYVEANSEAHNSIIASDAAYQLMQVYSPASTRFNLQHPTTDSFGAALIRSLRTGGYAIQEISKSNLAGSVNTIDDNDGATLAYIFDQSSDVYRLSIMIDEKILTRAYMPHEEGVVPGGSWVFKE